MNGVRFRCADCRKRKAGEWQKKNPEKRKIHRARWMAKVADKHKRERWLLKLDVVMNLGGACGCCGEDQLVFLTVDHILNDGAAHRKLVGKSYRNVYRDIQKLGYPRDRFRVLCWNCHMATRLGEPCPHRVNPDEMAVS